MEADVVVVGAGALGLSTALHCLFKSVQADALRTRLARRSIDLAVSFAD